jgi:hypothetical protein
MNPIGDIKGFMIDVIRNIIMVFGIGYMGGSVSALTHLNDTTLSKILPTDLSQSPYSGKKKGFSFTGYSFPYTLYERDTLDESQKIINWLVMTCMLVFSNIRSMIKYVSKIPNGIMYDFLLFYIVPYFLIQPILYGKIMMPIISFFIFLYAIFVGGFVFEEGSLKNGLWYWIAPFTLTYMAYKGSGKSEGDLGIISLMFKFFMCFITFFIIGPFLMFILYPMWWYSIAVAVMIYYTIFIVTLPYQYGFEKVIAEMSKHRLSLTIIFMLLTIRSSQSFLVSLATTGIIIGSIYTVYFLIKNKYKK